MERFFYFLKESDVGIGALSLFLTTSARAWSSRWRLSGCGFGCRAVQEEMDSILGALTSGSLIFWFTGTTVKKRWSGQMTYVLYFRLCVLWRGGGLSVLGSVLKPLTLRFSCLPSGCSTGCCSIFTSFTPFFLQRKKKEPLHYFILCLLKEWNQISNGCFLF